LVSFVARLLTQLNAMKITNLAWMLSCSLVLPVGLSAQSNERLADKDVIGIIEAVDQARDRFEDQLDGKIKDSTIRTPNGEVRVEAALQDLQDNVKKLKERFTKAYSASGEAATLLRQGTRINAHIKAQPGEIKGGSEWDRLAQELGRLANAYDTSFPLPEGAPVRRINDAEVAATADKLVKQVDQAKKTVDQDKSLAKTDRDLLKADLEQLAKHSKTVKSRAADAKPATAEARQVLALTEKIGTFLQGKPTQPATLTAWGETRKSLLVLEQAYRLKP
jgi:hypothetical protein